MVKHCTECGGPTQRWGRTPKGRVRFFCVHCKKTSIKRRKDIELRHRIKELISWLGGKETLSDLAQHDHKTRQALWKEFQPLFQYNVEPLIPENTKVRMLILDGTYIHGHILCTLVGIDENKRIYWRFAPYESYEVWLKFLYPFAQPDIVIMDGQKGLFAAARRLWPTVPIQRCQFHVIAFATNYLGRRPKDEMGRELLDILYMLKEAKTYEGRDVWIVLYKKWETKYEKLLSIKNYGGRFIYGRQRSARLIIRRALPYLFTFLDHPGAPNTTNLVEGWVNGAIADALRFHRGLRFHEKKLLVAVILAKLRKEKSKENNGQISGEPVV
jgi:hypothetical protein